MDIPRVLESVTAQWQSSIVERLTAYVRIQNKSPVFDPDWERHGYMDEAANLIADWCRKQPVAGMKVEVRRLPGLTPIVLVDVPGEVPDCVLMYGHLDKQPEFTGWLPGLGPWDPVIRDGKLYGRGGADDGYAAFSSLAAIVALKEQKVPLPPLRHSHRGLGRKRQHPSPAGASARARRNTRPAIARHLSRRRSRQL